MKKKGCEAYFEVTRAIKVTKYFEVITRVQMPTFKIKSTNPVKVT